MSTLRVAMDEHFQTCERCASVLEGTRNVIQLVWGRADDRGAGGIRTAAGKRLAQDARVRSKPGPYGRHGWFRCGDGFICGGLRVANSMTVDRS